MIEKLYYSICYYYDRNHISNINEHVKMFLNINVPNKIFIVNAVTNNLDDSDHINNYLNNYIKNIIYNDHFNIIVSYNWGGTIATLYNVYKFIKDVNNYDNDSNIYVCHFEEDFTYTNIMFLSHSIELLNNYNYIYIGEVTKDKCGVKDCDKKEFLEIINNYNNSNICNCYWTDGGYYFSSLKKLCEIEEKINGDFHKGNKTTLYHHKIDGIILGEVGFPTILKHNNFDFIGLPRTKYFIHNENIKV